MKRHFIQILLAAAVCCARGQSTFQYDQESATTDTGGNGVIAPIQSNQPIGQSFVPSLSEVGFIRLDVGDPVVPSGVGGTVSIDLWSGSLATGTLLGSTTPVSMSVDSQGYLDFFFSTPVAVTPGTTYFLQPILDSGDSQVYVGTLGSLSYANGTAYLQGVPDPSQLWFREGIVVPEPSTAMLALLGAAGIYFYRQKH